MYLRQNADVAQKIESKIREIHEKSDPDAVDLFATPLPVNNLDESSVNFDADDGNIDVGETGNVKD